MVRPAEIARARADTYRLLGRLCLAEVDARLLAALRQTTEFAPALAGDDAALLARLRAEYVRLFLVNAAPYESLYLDEQLLLNTAATVSVVEAYRDGGYSPAGQVGAPDHVGLELAFVGHLAMEESDALASANCAEVVGSRERQRAFLAEHLGRWAPVWAVGVGHLAHESFYRAFAGVVVDFVLGDLDAALSAAG